MKKKCNGSKRIDKQTYIKVNMHGHKSFPFSFSLLIGKHAVQKLGKGGG